LNVVSSQDVAVAVNDFMKAFTNLTEAEAWDAFSYWQATWEANR